MIRPLNHAYPFQSHYRFCHISITGINRNTVKALASNANARIDFPTLNTLCRTLGVLPGELIEYLPEDDEESR
ncbi:helix-turn-helix transcriptional regulator [Paenibacillus polymyxa]|nr:helix-turn-helix transcriptional regulator [Paenibacillus polymyxa]